MISLVVLVEIIMVAVAAGWPIMVGGWRNLSGDNGRWQSG